MGSYFYSGVLNGVTFQAEGNFVNLGKQTVVLYPVSAPASVPTGTFTGSVTIAPTKSGGTNGITCNNVSIKFISRATSTLKIVNISGSNYTTGLISGCGNYSSTTAAGKIGAWLNTAQARSIAGVQNIQIVCVNPTEIANLSDHLEDASIVYLNGRTSSQANAGTISVLRDWFRNGRGMVLDQGDEINETQFAQGLGFYIEAGTTSTINIYSNRLPHVLVNPDGYSLPATTPLTILSQGSNAAYVTSSQGVVFGGENNRRYLYADITNNQGIGNDTGAFIFGDKSGDNTDSNTYALWQNIFAWMIHNAPIY